MRYRDIESAFFVVSDSFEKIQFLHSLFKKNNNNHRHFALHPRKYIHSVFPPLPLKAYHSGSGTQTFTSVYTQRYKHMHKSLRTKDRKEKNDSKKGKINGQKRVRKSQNCTLIRGACFCSFFFFKVHSLK